LADIINVDIGGNDNLQNRATRVARHLPDSREALIVLQVMRGEYAQAHALDGQRRAISHAKLTRGVAHMGAGGTLADIEDGADIPIGFAGGNPFHDFPLAIGEQLAIVQRRPDQRTKTILRRQRHDV
jgi:hypothetical protein